MFVLFVYGVNLLVLSILHARRESLLPGIPSSGEADQGSASYLPRVTVQLPVFNEAHVVERLLDACSRLRYPREKLEIQVLDDSTDETTAVIAREALKMRGGGLSVEHLHRTHRDGYKAGALRDGLSTAKGELIAMFDADFVPTEDFLERMVPHFEDPEVGMVQARWGHINPDHSLLTRIQAFGLDTHFAIEQRIRNITGCFINFNGTAGIWRRECIEDAGGWTADTLTEDFDLSYRAQIRGWKFRHVPEVEVPAELPVAMNAFRDQQYRWTKGAFQTALKLLKPLWLSTSSPRVKWEGTIHLTANIVFPFIVIAALLHSPMVYLLQHDMGPGPVYFGLMSFGLLGFAGFFLAQLFSQKYLYADWLDRLKIFPIFMAGSIGMSLSNVRAIGSVIFGRETAFVRTPKYAFDREEGRSAWWRSRYSDMRVPKVAFGEILLAVYSTVGLIYTMSTGAWAAAPFQALFAGGFTMVALYNFGQYRLAANHGRRLLGEGHLM
jgi:cellulose synthase/poly-beta-1,6-N-acetylglucosamine synthase-like glycosyltransferase